MKAGPQVFISLGANLGDLESNFERARRALDTLPGTKITGSSAARLTAPVGVIGQPEFLNQVVRLATSLAPRELLESLLEIERALGRVRAGRWGPRIIDLDILFYGKLRLVEPGLTIPHPELCARPFFLEMIAEIDQTFLLGWPEFSAPEGD